ncbi:hypothetical protein RCL1_005393 [Eukaryota sp. TZLM3-RCL]
MTLDNILKRLSSESEPESERVTLFTSLFELLKHPTNRFNPDFHTLLISSIVPYLFHKRVSIRFAAEQSLIRITHFCCPHTFDAHYLAFTFLHFFPNSPHITLYSAFALSLCFTRINDLESLSILFKDCFNDLLIHFKSNYSPLFIPTTFLIFSAFRDNLLILKDEILGFFHLFSLSITHLKFLTEILEFKSFELFSLPSLENNLETKELNTDSFITALDQSKSEIFKSIISNESSCTHFASLLQFLKFSDEISPQIIPLINSLFEFSCNFSINGNEVSFFRLVSLCSYSLDLSSEFNCLNWTNLIEKSLIILEQKLFDYLHANLLSLLLKIFSPVRTGAELLTKFSQIILSKVSLLTTVNATHLSAFLNNCDEIFVSNLAERTQQLLYCFIDTTDRKLYFLLLFRLLFSKKLSASVTKSTIKLLKKSMEFWIFEPTVVTYLSSSINSFSSNFFTCSSSALSCISPFLVQFHSDNSFIEICNLISRLISEAHNYDFNQLFGLISLNLQDQSNSPKRYLILLKILAEILTKPLDLELIQSCLLKLFYIIINLTTFHLELPNIFDTSSGVVDEFISSFPLNNFSSVHFPCSYAIVETCFNCLNKIFKISPELYPYLAPIKNLVTKLNFMVPSFFSFFANFHQYFTLQKSLSFNFQNVLLAPCSFLFNNSIKCIKILNETDNSKLFLDSGFDSIDEENRLLLVQNFNSFETVSVSEVLNFSNLLIEFFDPLTISKDTIVFAFKYLIFCNYELFNSFFSNLNLNNSEFIEYIVLSLLKGLKLFNSTCRNLDLVASVVVEIFTQNFDSLSFDFINKFCKLFNMFYEQNIPIKFSINLSSIFDLQSKPIILFSSIHSPDDYSRKFDWSRNFLLTSSKYVVFDPVSNQSFSSADLQSIRYKSRDIIDLICSFQSYHAIMISTATFLIDSVKYVSTMIDDAFLASLYCTSLDPEAPSRVIPIAFPCILELFYLNLLDPSTCRFSDLIDCLSLIALDSSIEDSFQFSALKTFCLILKSFSEPINNYFIPSNRNQDEIIIAQNTAILPINIHDLCSSLDVLALRRHTSSINSQFDYVLDVFLNCISFILTNLESCSYSIVSCAIESITNIWNLISPAVQNSFINGVLLNFIGKIDGLLAVGHLAFSLSSSLLRLLTCVFLTFIDKTPEILMKFYNNLIKSVSRDQSRVFLTPLLDLSSALIFAGNIKIVKPILGFLCSWSLEVLKPTINYDSPFNSTGFSLNSSYCFSNFLLYRRISLFFTQLLLNPESCSIISPSQILSIFLTHHSHLVTIFSSCLQYLLLSNQKDFLLLLGQASFKKLIPINSALKPLIPVLSSISFFASEELAVILSEIIIDLKSKTDYFLLEVVEKSCGTFRTEDGFVTVISLLFTCLPNPIISDCLERLFKKLISLLV